MTEKYQSKLHPLIKKNSNEKFVDATFKCVGPNMVWLDVANESKTDISLCLKMVDEIRNISAILIGEVSIPAGSFLTIFAHKLIIDKTLIVRTSESSVVYFSSKRDDM